MTKSPDAFRTISEVAETLDVPPHVLRFWETRFTQVKPVKRGGGRRYYRPEDVRLLRGIRGLLYDDGMTIKGVQKILRERGIRHVIGLGTLTEGEPLEVAEPAGTTAPAASPAEPVAASADPVYPRAVEAEPQRDLFAAVTALAAEGETTTMPIDRPIDEPSESAPRSPAPQRDKAALRELVARLVALRAVMTEDPR